MSNFWIAWIFILTFICLFLVTGLLIATTRSQRKQNTMETTGHNYDGIEEYDNPMPAWWLGLFVSTLIFAVIYLVLFPGVWKGVLGWTQIKQLEAETEKHTRQYAPLFKQYAAQSIEALQSNSRAIKMGQRIFLNNCTICHGSDARGAFGFPNLTDGNWLWGGASDEIKYSVMEGRSGQMPAWGVIIGEIGVRNVSAYARSLSGIDTGFSKTDLNNGKKVFDTTCSVCHGVEGKGNKLLGAPNLTDHIWLYGSSQSQVMYTVRNGRNGIMPPWKEILGDEKVHLVTAYIYSLSHKKDDP
ncbi:MAG: cytochrome-c oxidase, cbb3-type subunit III [Endozoicomonadaceae bacterium]|nr:cytochrome-c oxidase, cbb3-type subunit III [Endozoicomonadaceae bacterium]